MRKGDANTGSKPEDININVNINPRLGQDQLGNLPQSMLACGTIRAQQEPNKSSARAEAIFREAS